MVDWEIKARTLTRIGVTAVILLVCTLLILYKYPDDFTKWAFGMVGVVVGYWLR